jgi:hypothetical protein
VRAGARDVDTAKSSTEIALQFGLLAPEQLSRLQWVEFDLEEPEGMAAALGNASRVIIQRQHPACSCGGGGAAARDVLLGWGMLQWVGFGLEECMTAAIWQCQQREQQQQQCICSAGTQLVLYRQRYCGVNNIDMLFRGDGESAAAGSSNPAAATGKCSLSVEYLTDCCSGWTRGAGQRQQRSKQRKFRGAAAGLYDKNIVEHGVVAIVFETTAATGW